MIIKMLLEELFTQLRDVSDYENIEIYKVVDGRDMRSYYSSMNNNKSNYELDKIMSSIKAKKYIMEMINIKEEIFIENIQYDFQNINFKKESGSVSICCIPLLINENNSFCIILSAAYENFNYSEKQKSDISEVIDSFKEVLCFDEMIRMDRVRDRVLSIC